MATTTRNNHRDDDLAASLGVDPSAHRVRWFARFPGSAEDWIPATADMVRSGYGWDVRCSCGQESHTGGYTERAMRDRVWDHRHLGHNL